MTMTLPGWLVILAEQLIIVLLVLSAIFYFRARKLKRLLREMKSTDIPRQTGSEQTATKGGSPPTPISSIDVEFLQKKLELSQQRVKNLEQFRDMFFDLKNKVSGLLDSQERMYGQMQDAGLPLAEQQALREAYEKLRDEKERLEQHLSQVDAELEVLLADRHKSETSDNKADDSELMQTQQSEIHRLVQEIADLTIEASGTAQINSTVAELSQRSGELAIAVEILQDENQFLSDQIQALLQQQNDKDRHHQRDIAGLKNSLARLQVDYDTLNEKHTKLESEYLKLQG